MPKLEVCVSCDIDSKTKFTTALGFAHSMSKEADVEFTWRGKQHKIKQGISWQSLIQNYLNDAYPNTLGDDDET